MINDTASTDTDAGQDTTNGTPDLGVPVLVWGRSKDGRHHRLEVAANLGGTPGFTLCGRFAETPPIHGEPGIGCVGCWQRERDLLDARIDQLTAELRAVRTENVPGVGALTDQPIDLDEVQARADAARLLYRGELDSTQGVTRRSRSCAGSLPSREEMRLGSPSTPAVTTRRPRRRPAGATTARHAAATSPRSRWRHSTASIPR